MSLNSVKSKTYELFLTEDFVSEIKSKISMAEDRIFIQLMTFDGDRAGLEIAGLLHKAMRRGVEVRLLIDCFTERFVSDQKVHRPEVAAEVKATEKMYRDLRAAGASIKFTSPYGFMNIFVLVRNHKKIFIVDNEAYLGGINVSDHNFSWHDFNVCIRDKKVLEETVADFNRTFDGKNEAVQSSIITNENLEETFDSLLSEAKESIVLASPYALDVGLAKAAKGLKASKKEFIINAKNNFRIYRLMQPYLLGKLVKSGFQIRAYEKFSHAKFLLIDGKKLLIGSSNFGRHSFWCNREIGIVIEDKQFIKEFSTMLIEGSSPVKNFRRGKFYTFCGKIFSHLMHGWLVLLRRGVVRHAPTLSSK